MVYQFVSLFSFFYQTVIKLQTFLFPNIFNASRKYKPSVLQKRPLHPIPVGESLHKCNLHLKKTKIPAVVGVSRQFHLYLKANVRLSVAKTIFKSLRSHARSGDVV